MVMMMVSLEIHMIIMMTIILMMLKKMMMMMMTLLLHMTLSVKKVCTIR